MHCWIGPDSPDWIASTAVRSMSSSVRAIGVPSGRPASSGANTLSISRARCSAPQSGKLHQISPQPTAPSSSSTRTNSAGRSRITPNEVRTGVGTGKR